MQTPSNTPTRLAAVSMATIAMLLGGCAGLSNLIPDYHDGQNEAAASEPAGPEVLLRVAETRRAAGDEAMALSLYRRAHTLYPEHLGVALKLGEMLTEAGLAEEAYRAFSAALDVNPQSATAHRGLANANLALNQLEAAVEGFRVAIDLDGHVKAFNGLGVALDLLGDHAGAQRVYRTGLRHFPDHLMLRNNLGLSLALTGELQEAVRILSNVAADPSATSKHRQNLALAYGLSGNVDEAARISRLDLSEQTVQSNLAYFRWLRAQSEVGIGDIGTEGYVADRLQSTE